MKKTLLSLFVMLLIVTLLVSGCGKSNDQGSTTQESKTLKLGFIMPFSGPGSLWGDAIKKDLDAYADVINMDGGLKIGDDNYMIETYYADDVGEPDKVVNAALTLVENNSVDAILGYWGVGLSSLAQVTTPKKVITIITKPLGYNPATMPYTAFAYNDSFLGIPQPEAILNYFTDTKVMGISASDYYFEGGKDSLPFLEEMLKERGIELFIDTYAWETLDFTQHVEKLHAAGVNTVYSWAAPQHEAMIQKLIYELGYDMKFAGTGTVVDLKSYIEMSGYEAAQGGLHPHNYPWDLKEIPVAPETVQAALSIKDRYEAKYNEEFSYDGSFSYGLNSMQLYLLALQKAGTTDPDAVMAEIEGGTFDLFTGTYTMSGKERYGRAVFAGLHGSMGVVDGYKSTLVSEAWLPTTPK